MILTPTGSRSVEAEEFSVSRRTQPGCLGKSQRGASPVESASSRPLDDFPGSGVSRTNMSYQAQKLTYGKRANQSTNK